MQEELITQLKHLFRPWYNHKSSSPVFITSRAPLIDLLLFKSRLPAPRLT